MLLSRFSRAGGSFDIPRRHPRDARLRSDRHPPVGRELRQHAFESRAVEVGNPDAFPPVRQAINHPPDLPIVQRRWARRELLQGAYRTGAGTISMQSVL